MNIGDIIISRSGNEYVIDKFIDIANEPGVNLKSVNGSGSDSKVMKIYLHYFLSTGVYTNKGKPVIKKLRKRNRSTKFRTRRNRK